MPDKHQPVLTVAANPGANATTISNANPVDPPPRETLPINRDGEDDIPRMSIMAPTQAANLHSRKEAEAQTRKREAAEKVKAEKARRTEHTQKVAAIAAKAMTKRHKDREAAHRHLEARRAQEEADRLDRVRPLDQLATKENQLVLVRKS